MESKENRMGAAAAELMKNREAVSQLAQSSDAQKLRDNQPDFARGIYYGLLSYFGFSPTNR